MIRTAIAIALLVSTSHAGHHVKKAAKAQAKAHNIASRPFRRDARAAAGYPFWQTAANVTGFGLGLPIGFLFRVLK